MVAGEVRPCVVYWVGERGGSWRSQVPGEGVLMVGIGGLRMGEGRLRGEYGARVLEWL